MRVNILTIILLALLGISSATVLPWNKLPHLDLASIPQAAWNELGTVLGGAMVHHVKDRVTSGGLKIRPTSEIDAISEEFDFRIFSNEIPLPINISVDEPPGGPSSGLVVGQFKICDDVALTIYGLEDPAPSLDFKKLMPITVEVNVALNSSSIAITGTHAINGIFLMNLFPILSTGQFNFTATNFDVHLSLEIFLNATAFFNVKAVGFRLNFDKLMLQNDGETFFNGTRINWDALSNEAGPLLYDLLPVVELILNEFVSPPLSQFLTTTIVGNCGLHHLPQLITNDFTCLGLEEAETTPAETLFNIVNLLPFRSS